MIDLELVVMDYISYWKLDEFLDSVEHALRSHWITMEFASEYSLPMLYVHLE